MNKFLSTAKSTVGFTLIELLVVIGILGILAAALVATIDPFEQLRKAEDANIENAEIEFINAVIRYYTINSGYPWYGINVGGDECAGAQDDDEEYELPATSLDTWIDATGAIPGGCLDVLIESGELKESFAGAEGILDEIWVFQEPGSTGVTACYDPGSKAKTENAETKYTTVVNAVAGTGDATECVGTSNGANESCFRCTSG